MLAATAQDAAMIQYPQSICLPFFGVKREYKLPPDPIMAELSDNKLEELIRTPSFVSPRWSRGLIQNGHQERSMWPWNTRGVVFRQTLRTSEIERYIPISEAWIQADTNTHQSHFGRGGLRCP